MESPTKKQPTSLFDVYLRLRPNPTTSAERFLDVEAPEDSDNATHITIHPPANDVRKRAIEKFGFTRVFEEESSQLDIFHGTTVLPMIEGVLAPSGRPARDALVATLGVTGSGKSHTILGSKSQRGLTQMILSVLYNSIGSNMADSPNAVHELAATDVSEAQILAATPYLDFVYGDPDPNSRSSSRAQTPMVTGPASSMNLYKSLMNLTISSKSPVRTPSRLPRRADTIRPVSGFARIAHSLAKLTSSPPKQMYQDTYSPAPASSHRRHIPRPSMLPQQPNMDDIQVAADPKAEYAILISMYEVYNDKIFDLLTATATHSKTPVRDSRRRPLLFKSTEYSPDRKVVAGLKKIVCSSLEEALMVLETGLTERRVAGTGSNAVSSRSHGFFGIEVKKRNRTRLSEWIGSSLTIVDLAGSERARTAKTAGTTLAEAGKINESLMYLGQCMQMQSDNSALLATVAGEAAGSTAGKPGLVPFRQCKLTELLFSNSFHERTAHRNTPTQRAVMIVTADPRGDFNATSQILKYSALAREVTVPRIPSVTSTILSGPTAICSPTEEQDFRNFPQADVPLQTVASEDLQRLVEEVTMLRLQLDDETRRREEAEAAWQSSEARLEEIEAEVREECWVAFEDQLAAEKANLLAAWAEEAQRNEKHLDSKLDVLTRTFDIADDADAEDELNTGGWRQRAEDLEVENDRLQEKLNALLREKEVGRTPSKKLKPLRTRKWEAEEEENVDPFA